MKHINHPFFDAVDEISKAKRWSAFSGEAFPRLQFYKALKEAQVFIFDKKTTNQAIRAGMIGTFESDKKFHPEELVDRKSKVMEKASAVEEFSLPFKTCLYLLTDAPEIMRSGTNQTQLQYKRFGYLVQEISPEKIRVYDIMNVNFTEADHWLAIPDFYDIDLKGEISEEVNFGSDILCINRMTNMISVKRVGIEHGGSRTLKTKGIGAGYTTVKYERLLYVADKEEYEYSTSVAEGEINWEWAGWWRGHWRAFYCYAGDKKLKDQFGRNIVDYNRRGKNRAGEPESVPGYAWVVEHIKGDPKLAEIKVRAVIKK